MNYDIPILFIFFNRVKEAKEAFAPITAQTPKKIYLISDGGRTEQEWRVVEECRRTIESMITWDCDVVVDYSEKNLGCRQRVYTGITKALQKEERVIIIEDDIITNRAFFRFMGYALTKYEKNNHIMMVTGYRHISGMYPQIRNIVFSKYPSVWGWGTWKEAWDKLDIDMNEYRRYPQRIIKKSKGYISAKMLINAIDFFNKITIDKMDTWDYQWLYVHLINHGRCVVPPANLVRNIGFNENATHTKKKEDNIIDEVSELQYGVTLKNKRSLDIVYNKNMEKMLAKDGFLKCMVKIFRYKCIQLCGKGNII